jgi:hypothetical protein
MKDGDLAGQPLKGTAQGTTVSLDEGHGLKAGDLVFVDYYVSKSAANVSELQIDAENFAGYYYVEADCLFRRQSTGVDMPAALTIPKVKIQSNFSFNMAATGDPSTFTFTMDAMPDYTLFNKSRKVLCAIQIVEDSTAGSADLESVFPCENN